MPDRGAGGLLPEKPMLILMDGHAIVHRAWHAIQRPLTLESTGEDVRAVYGFINFFLRVVIQGIGKMFI
mgnify:CR=1 FL=1